MRISVMATIAAAALLPTQAAAQPAAGARVHARHAGTTWQTPVKGRMGTREAYRRDDYGSNDHRGDREPLYGDEGYADDYRYAPYYGDTDAYGADDHALSDRFVRDGDGRLDYDRDYPYDAPYGNYGGYYEIVETTVTTGPSVVTYAEEKVAVHRAKRMVKKRLAYRTSARSAAAKTCYC